MVALLLAGTVVFCAGLLTVVFGIPIKEFSFGNTMILAGAVIACTGLLLMGLALVVREVKNLVRHLGDGAALRGIPAIASDARSRVPDQPKAIRGPARNSGKNDLLFSRDEHDPDFTEELDRAYPSANHHVPSLSPSDDIEVRARSVPPPRQPERETAERPRRDILFSSSRRDQQNGAGSDFISSADEFSGRDPSAGMPDPFDASWPPADRARSDSDFAADPQRNGRAPRNGTSRHQPPRRNEATSVSVVKSGVVDAMAYSLYSDGSIEAQMPEGMVRFESIDELRAHLDQRN